MSPRRALVHFVARVSVRRRLRDGASRVSRVASRVSALPPLPPPRLPRARRVRPRRRPPSGPPRARSAQRGRRRSRGARGGRRGRGRRRGGRRRRRLLGRRRERRSDGPPGGADVVGGVGLGLSYATGTTFDDLAEDVAEKFKTIAGIADAQGGNATDADAILEYIAEGGENPYSFLYGVDENAAEVNKRLLCRRGCLDPLVDVNLVWCAGAVTYSYCNRVVADDPQAAVLDMEEGAIAAYMRLVRVVPTPDAPECKPILRAWMCYEFFNRCNTDGTEFYPVCHTTCAAAKYACGNPAWIECDQEVEELENSAPDEWFVDGDRSQPYIRGLKPDGSLGSPVFETDQLRCTGGGRGRFGGTEFAFAFAAAALAATWRERALPPRPNAAYRESAS